MDLGIKDQWFIVGGATSGLGKGVAEALLAEGAKIIAVARSTDKLAELAAQHPEQVETLALDLTKEGTVSQLVKSVGDRVVAGMVVNAGGPPAMPAKDTSLQDWDDAYAGVFRWKIDLVNQTLPAMISRGYGRILFIESMSVKQPVENLVLSNSMRLAVVGYVKTLSTEIGKHGITLNILAPGYHDTPRITSLLKKNATLKGVSEAEVRSGFESQINVGFMGDPADFGALGAWLLSPQARYLTGQTISVDGGVIKGTMG
ncbi:MAG: SDR family oxidoreductase [Saprospiraceae bacterium]|nr:SDR family oxidoreductase [Saprospiraceae bacterium]